MNVDIRQAVIGNLKGTSHDDLDKTIVDAVDGKDEKTLPGLGVLFELVWNSANQSEKSKLIDSITSQL